MKNKAWGKVQRHAEKLIKQKGFSRVAWSGRNAKAWPVNGIDPEYLDFEINDDETKARLIAPAIVSPTLHTLDGMMIVL